VTTLLEKALEKVGTLPQNEQDAIASQFSYRLRTKKPGKSASPKSVTSSGA
jgi:hypothetical protein